MLCFEMEVEILYISIGSSDGIHSAFNIAKLSLAMLNASEVNVTASE